MAEGRSGPIAIELTAASRVTSPPRNAFSPLAASAEISKGLTFENRTVRDKTRTRASAIVAPSSKGHSPDDNNGPAVAR